MATAVANSVHIIRLYASQNMLHQCYKTVIMFCVVLYLHYLCIR